MRILVVEDDATLRAQLVQAIAGAGHTVEAAAARASSRRREGRERGVFMAAL